MKRVQLHNNLKAWRKSAGGLTQRELAEKAGVTRQSIISIERGKYRPGVELALTLARVLECRVEDLFQLKEEGE